MLKVLNVSTRYLYIGGYKIAPLAFQIFDMNIVSTSTKQKIDTFVTLGLVKVSSVEAVLEPANISLEETTKKATKKSK